METTTPTEELEEIGRIATKRKGGVILERGGITGYWNNKGAH